MIKAGELRHRITLLEPVVTRDDIGAYIYSYEEFTTIWAKISPVNTLIKEENRTQKPLITHQITCRGIDTGEVNTKWRISFNSRTFAVTSVLLVDEINDERLIEAVELQATTISQGS